MDGFGRKKKFEGTKEVCGIWVGKKIDLSEKYLCFSLDLLFCDLNFSFHTCGGGWRGMGMIITISFCFEN